MDNYSNDPIQMVVMLLATTVNECNPSIPKEAALATFLKSTLERIRGCRSNKDVFRELLVGCNAIICTLDGSSEWQAYMVETANTFFDGINRAFIDDGDPGYRKALLGDPLTTELSTGKSSPESPASIARTPSTPYEQLVTLSTADDWEVRAGVAANEATPDDLLRKLAVDPDEGVRSYVARNENTPGDVLEALSSDASEYVRDFLAQNSALPLSLMSKLAADPNWRPRSGIAENPNAPSDLLVQLAMDPDVRVRELARKNPNWDARPVFPEAEIIDLIASLEAGDCTIPASESARLSTITPRAASEACSKAISLRKSGDLVGANEAFIEMFRLQDAINPTALWTWARVLLLAKDFRHAQLLLHAECASEYRGVQLFNPFVWMNIRLNLPGFEVNWLHDGSVPNYEIYGVNWFDNPKQLAERIRTLGNDGGYWQSNYEWTANDYAEFIRYFSPLSYLAYDDTLYAWTNDDQEELKAFYDDIYSKMLGQHEPEKNHEACSRDNQDVDCPRGQVLDLPDAAICDLIDELESNSCEFPEADNYWYAFSATSGEMVKALQLLKDGDLEGAHTWFSNTFGQLTVIVPVFLSFWSIVCLLAKDFGHAQLLMQLREANSKRGQQWYDFDSNSVMERFLTPKPKEMSAQQYETYLLENKIDLYNRSAVEHAIAEKVDKDGYWMTHYRLSDDEFKEFHRYFGESPANYKHEFEDK